MDRRSWPWKKKSSDKAAAEKTAVALASNGTQNEDNYKKPKYVQISVEQYSNLTSLEDKVETYEEQVQSFEDKINELNEKLTAANSEMTSKDILVKQHAKVAEEAVSGWEKAEAEAVALKGHLESVTLSKLTADDRAAHLDGALKECMRQIRNLKEEHEQKMQDLAFSKTKQFEKMKLELEGKMANLEQELLKSAAENAALSRSLQDCSNMLIKINEEKSQAEAEIELLKSNIESCEREINSFKYELHVLSKELEIRNEEKNMYMRSADAANKQLMDGVKKIAKLEAECQRLRGLVRKKLPGPAALAQMKLEVDSLGRDYGESRLRRSPSKPSSPHFSPLTEFSLDNVQKYQKENEFLTERLLATEEETKMLKEALTKRNSELQATRSMFAKTASKLQNFEAQLHISNHQKSSPKSISHLPIEGSLSQHASSPPSLTSFSEDGIDDDKSCAESSATGLVPELSHFKKERHNDKPSKAENSNHLNLMDDFLEMEKLACMSNDSNGVRSVSYSSNTKVHDAINHDDSDVSTSNGSLPKEHNHSNGSNHLIVKSSESSPGSDADQLPLMKLRSRICTLLDSASKQMDLLKILEEIKQAVQETCDTLKQDTVGCITEDVHCSNASYHRQANPEDSSLTTEKDITLCQSPEANAFIITEDLEAAISSIHDFVLFLDKQAIGVHGIFPDGSGFSQKIEEFSTTFSKFKCSNLSLVDFIVELSQVLTKASELRFNILGFKGVESETSSPDCIDKVALPENKDVQKDSSSSESYQNGCSHMTSSTSDPEVPDDGNLGNLVLGYASNTASGKFSLEEFQQLKSEKDSLAKDLASCTESLEITKSQLHQTEQLLIEAKSQLACAEKSNSLAETQLKCMAESYRSLEKRAHELERELNVLRDKIETVENELQDERSSHQDALIRCKELVEELQRNECSVNSSVADNEQTKQDKDLEAAAEKLAECQETIFLLGKQLNALRPQSEVTGSQFSEQSLRDQGLPENKPTNSGMNLRETDAADMDTATSANAHRISTESHIDIYSSPCSPSNADGNPMKSPINSKNTKHRPTKSSCSSSLSIPTPEKHTRGISRFFSSKGKNGY